MAAAAAAIVVGLLAERSPAVGVAAGFGVAMAALLVQIMIWADSGHDESDDQDDDPDGQDSDSSAPVAA